MTGLNLGINGISIENVHQDSSDFFLLARGDGSEVILQTIKKDKPFYVFPGEEAETMEFIYIVEGECSYNSDEKLVILKKNDYFYVQDLQETVFFSALTDMKLLWYTTKPAFHLISTKIGKLASVVKQVETKDNYTYEHSIRVLDYCLKLAGMLKLSKERIEDLYFASLFHDVGKINIPEEILNKPGRLTDEEFSIMKQHSYDGYIMVKDLYYTNISQIILQHHERLDGSGYPYGLKADDILLEAKIIGIADSYDAMTYDRPYRKGMPPAYVMEEIKSLAGIHYDPYLVEMFEKALILDGVLEVK